MTGYLLDTNIISMFAPDRPKVSDEMRLWMRENGTAGRLFLSVVTIAEIEKGVSKLKRKGAIEKFTHLEEWLRGLEALFADRILPVEIAVALIAGAMEDDMDGKGLRPGLADIFIAATAKSRGLKVMTFN